MQSSSIPVKGFPPGTPVCVRQSVARGRGVIETEIVGVVGSWKQEATGSWHAHGRHDKLWLQRLKLRKADGEVVSLVIDDGTTIARLEPEAS